MPFTKRVVIAGCLLLFGNAAWALPELQLYVEGATYDTTTETWEIQYPDSGTIRLWAIGNVSGEGGKGLISDVKLAVAYPDQTAAPIISLTPTTTGGLGGFTDPSTPIAASYNKTVTDGSVPTLSDGSALPSHDVYGTGVSWQEFALGNFGIVDGWVWDTKKKKWVPTYTGDSPGGDFINSFPAPIGTAGAQINVYDVSVAGLAAGDWVHFDLYNSVQSGCKARAVFAPFSHDGGAGGDTPPGVVPEPATLILLGTGLLGIGGIARRRTERKTAKETQTS